MIYSIEYQLIVFDLCLYKYINNYLFFAEFDSKSYTYFMTDLIDNYYIMSQTINV